MPIVSMINWRRLASAFVPGVLVATIGIYVLGSRAPPSPGFRVLPSKALAVYDDFYPIRTNDTGALYLDRELFAKAVSYLSQHPSPRAVAGLIYLGNSNDVTLLPDEPTKAKYLTPTRQSNYVTLSEVDREKDRIFQPYTNVVNGIGQTFTSTPVEIVLHDMRDPLRSIMAVQSHISGRRLGDMNTSFGIQFTKNYSYGERQGQGCGASFVSCDLTLRGGHAVKSTTIPILYDVYGLIGFICINIDISKTDKRHPEYIERSVDTFKTIIANNAINEMIQNNKRKD